MTFSILREVKRPFSKKNIVQDLVAGFRSETLPHTKQLGTQQVEDDGGVKDFDENLVSFYLLALPFASNQVLGFVSNRPHPTPLVCKFINFDLFYTWLFSY